MGDINQEDFRDSGFPLPENLYNGLGMEPYQKEFSAALRLWMKRRGFNQSQLAVASDVKQSSISEYLSGKKSPPLDAIGKIVLALGIDLATFFQPEDPFEGYTLVPKSTARPRGGEGGLETDSDFVGLYAFKTDFLIRKGSPSKMKLFEVDGDSMSPTIPDKSLVLIDESQAQNITSGKIYLVRWGDEFMLKRLFQEPGMVLVRSDNVNFPSKEVSQGEIDILGRAVWVGTEI